VKEEPSIVQYYLDYCDADIATIPWVDMICQYGYADMNVIQYLIEEKKVAIIQSYKNWKGEQFLSAFTHAMKKQDKTLIKYFFELVNIDDDVSLVFVLFLLIVIALKPLL